MDTVFNYSFPALRGTQAGNEYYVIMCPLRLIPKIFLFNEEEIPAPQRAQRILNKNRVPEITNYIVENPNDYVFSSLTASIDGETSFEPFSEAEATKDLGKLIVSLDAKFLINDGQHRRAAIEEALKTSPELGDETISVVFFKDEGLTKSQQIFSDLNRHAVNTTSSIGILYDHRDELALITKEVVNNQELLRRYTDNERVSLSKNSPKLVALNQVFNANLKLLGKTKGDLINEQDKQMIREFWDVLCSAIDEWKQVLNKELTPREVRMNYIVGHGIFLEAAGLVAHAAIQQDPNNWHQYISKLNSIDWNRQNLSDWEGRAFSKNGRINKNNQTIVLTANKIKHKIGLELTKDEQKLEQKHLGGEPNE